MIPSRWVKGNTHPSSGDSPLRNCHVFEDVDRIGARKSFRYSGLQRIRKLALFRASGGRCTRGSLVGGGANGQQPIANSCAAAGSRPIDTALLVAARGRVGDSPRGTSENVTDNHAAIFVSSSVDAAKAARSAVVN